MTKIHSLNNCVASNNYTENFHINLNKGMKRINQGVAKLNKAIQGIQKSLKSNASVNSTVRPMTSEEKSRFDQKMKKAFGLESVFAKKFKNAESKASKSTISEERISSQATITKDGVTRDMTPEEKEEFDQTMKHAFGPESAFAKNFSKKNPFNDDECAPTL